MKPRRGDNEASFTSAVVRPMHCYVGECSNDGIVMKRTNGRLWYRIEPSTGMTVFGLDGPMSFDEWQRVVETALRDPRRRPGRILSDRRRMSGAHSVAFVERIVEYLDRRRDALGPTRWAVLTADQDAVYGMVRMAQVLAEPTNVEVQAFTQLGPAVAWLLDDLDVQRRTDVVQWIEQDAAGEVPVHSAASTPSPL